MFSISMPAGCLGDPPMGESVDCQPPGFLAFLSPYNQTDARQNSYPGDDQSNRYPLIQEEHATHGSQKRNTDLDRGRGTGFESG